MENLNKKNYSKLVEFLSLYWQILSALVLLVAACCCNILYYHSNAAWSLAGLSGVVVLLAAIIGFSKYMYPYDFISYAMVNFACVLFSVGLLGGSYETNMMCLALGIFVSFVITEVFWYFEDHVSYGFNNVHMIAGLLPALISFVICCMIYAALMQ